MRHALISTKFVVFQNYEQEIAAGAKILASCNHGKSVFVMKRKMGNDWSSLSINFLKIDHAKNANFENATRVKQGKCQILDHIKTCKKKIKLYLSII